MKKQKYSVWSWSTYRKENPIRIIKLFFRDIKYSIQRIKYGWCESDTWDIDIWFLNVMPEMLKYLKEHKYSYPVSFDENGKTFPDSEEKWDKTIDQMIHLFEEAAWDVCSTKEEKEYKEGCKNQAFELFSEYFYELWD